MTVKTEIERLTGNPKITAAMLRAVLHKLAPAYFTPEMFNAAGDGETDDTAAINAADAAAAIGGKLLLLRGRYLAQSQLLQSSGVTWQFQGGEIIRGWTSTNPDKQVNATIRNRGAPTLASFYVDPGPYVPTNVDEGCRLIGIGTIRFSPAARQFVADNDESGTPARMTQLYWVCHRAEIGTGIRIESGGRDWAVTYWGDGFVGGVFEIFNGEHIFEDGFHVLGGSGGRIFGPAISSGDDSIAFGSSLNQAIDNWIVVAPKLFSRRAFAIKFANARIGVASGFAPVTEVVQNIKIVAPTWRAAGRPSRNGYARWDSGSEAPGVIRNCHVIESDFQGENNGLPAGETSGVAAVGGKGSTNCSFQGLIRHPSMWGVMVEDATRPRLDIVCPDAPNWLGTTPSIRAVDIRRCTGAGIDGDYAGGVRGAVVITDSTGTFSERLSCRDTPDTSEAILLGGTTDGYICKERLELLKKAGAADARGVTATAASDVLIASVIHDVNQLINPAITPARLRIGSEWDIAPTT